MDTFVRDLRYAVRALNMRRGFTLIACITLALGIGATTAIFSVVRGVLLRPLPFPESDRLVSVWQGATTAVAGASRLLSSPNYEDVRDQLDSFESISLYSASTLTVTEPGQARLVSGAWVTPQFFRTFGADPVMGREFTLAEDEPSGPMVAVVSDGFWREELGANPDVVGSTIRINSVPHEIVGVAPAGFSFPGEARIWIPSKNDDEGCGRGCVLRQAAGRLAPGVSLERAQAQLEELAVRIRQQYPESSEGVMLLAATLHDVTVGDVRGALLVLLGAVAMVLLIACANVANLILVRGRSRATEIAVRTTLGADRHRIVSQLLTENVVLAVLGGTLGVLLAAYGVNALRAIAPAGIPRLDEVRLDALTLLFAGGLVAGTVLLFGLAPALHLSRLGLAASLRAGGRGDVSNGRRNIGRSAILAAEVALSVMLLLGAGLLLRSFARMLDVRPGFNAADVTQFRLSLGFSFGGAQITDMRYPEPGDRVRVMEELRTRLLAVPGIEDVAVMVAPPLSGTAMFGNFARTDRPPPASGDEPGIHYRIADENAFRLLGIPVIAGRAFLASDRRGAPPVAMISAAAAAQYFPGEDAVGRVIDVMISAGYDEDAPRTIVGVFGDIRGSRITQAPEPELMIPYAQSGAGFPNVLMRGRMPPPEMLAAARAVLQAVDPELPMARPGIMDEFLARQLAQPRFYLLLLGLFATLAVVLAAVGLYGVVAYAVAQRTREIGLRMALGARVAQVVNLVLWQGMRPALLGLTLGLLGAIAAARVIRGLLFEVAPRDPVTFAAVPIVLIIVVLIASAAPAARASRIPPATALRE
jgi:predicted permease